VADLFFFKVGHFLYIGVVKIEFLSFFFDLVLDILLSRKKPLSSDLEGRSDSCKNSLKEIRVEMKR
jgi:hypothetical protein